MRTVKNFLSRRNLGTNFIIVLLLSFGLGAASVLFTALERLLLHPLQVAHPETLVRLAEKRASDAPCDASRSGDCLA